MADFKPLVKREIPGPEKSFVEMVDEALIANYAKEKEGPGYFPLRPSGASSCGRKLAYELASYMGLTEKYVEARKPALIRLLNFGHSVEYSALKDLKMIQGFKVTMAQQVVDLFRLPSGRLISGSIDALMIDEKNGHKVLLDVKSVGLNFNSSFGNSWDAMISKYDRMPSMYKFSEDSWYIEDPIKFIEEIGEDALVSNIIQMNLYILSSFMKERGVNVGSVYRYCKSNSRIMEIRFKPSQELFDRVKAKFDLIETKVLEGKMDEVPRGLIVGPQPCVWCPPDSPCWAHEKKPKPDYSHLPKKVWAEDISNLSDQCAETLTAAFTDYKEVEFLNDKKIAMENKILALMEENDVDKLKLVDGTIYQRVFLKSPRPHFELRRSAK